MNIYDSFSNFPHFLKPIFMIIHGNVRSLSNTYWLSDSKVGFEITLMA